MGARAAEEVLSLVQLRAPGRGKRGRDRALAGTPALVPAGRRVRVPQAGDRARDPHPGAPPGADVPDPVALERGSLAGDPAHARRQEDARATPPHAGRRSPRGRVSPGRGVLRAHPRRHRGSVGAPGRPADGRRLPDRGHGHRGARNDPAWDPRRRVRARRARRSRALSDGPRDPERAPVRLPGRRPRRGAANARGLDAPQSRLLRRRLRGSRSRSDRARPRRGVAGSARPGRGTRRARLAGDRDGARGRAVARVARRARGRAPRDARDRGRCRLLDLGGAPARSSRRLAGTLSPGADRGAAAERGGRMGRRRCPRRASPRKARGTRAGHDSGRGLGAPASNRAAWRRR